jgi:hypothetical protein
MDGTSRRQLTNRVEPQLTCRTPRNYQAVHRARCVEIIALASPDGSSDEAAFLSW